MVQVNRVCLKILFINRPQFLVDSNELMYKMNSEDDKPYDIGPKGKKRALPADQHLVNGQDSDDCTCCA